MASIKQSLTKLQGAPQDFLAHEWRARLHAEKNNAPELKSYFLDTLQHRMRHENNREGADRVVNALAFAASVEYSHKGLSSEAYLNHPIRVATMVLEETSPTDIQAVIIGLIHNVLEVSCVNKKTLQSIFGQAIVSAVQSLTVDRNRLDDRYKQDYYDHLNRGARSARIVKILDKLDNVFMICFNPNESVRLAYLDEIERWVQPMARIDLPGVAELMDLLTKTMRSIGHQDKQAVAAHLLT